MSCRRIEAVIFDMDDTLLDWSQMTASWDEIIAYHTNRVHDYLRTQGHLLPDKETFRQHYTATIKQSWVEARRNWTSVCFADVIVRTLVTLGLDMDQIDLKAVLAAYGYRPFPDVQPFADAKPVLDTLQDRGYRLGIITNSMMPMHLRDMELAEYGLLHYFDVRIASGDCGYIKPHPAIYRRALQQLGTAPRQAVFVGDRPNNDILGAIHTGLVSVWMNPAHNDKDLNGIRPDFTITALSQLLPILESLEANAG